MTRVELTAEERDALERALEHQLSELGDEITHTDSEQYKRALKHQRALIHGLLGRLRGADVGV